MRIGFIEKFLKYRSNLGNGKCIKIIRVKDYFLSWFYYCKSHRKRLIYTQDCNEKMYYVMQTIGGLEPYATLVGIPKEGQNRNLDVIREFE